jgi:hypothetical protein
MEHVVDGTFDLQRLGDVVLHEPEPRIRHERLDVSAASRQQIVHTENIMSLGEETLAQVRPDETTPSRDDRSQGSPPEMTSDSGPGQGAILPDRFMIQRTTTITKPHPC